MTGSDLVGLAPMIVLSLTAVAVMLAASFVRRHAVSACLTVTGLLVAIVSVAWAMRVAPRQVTPLVVVDAYAMFYTSLICAASLVVAVLSYEYWENRPVWVDEMYVLLLLATLGSVVLVSSTHFASFFVGLEILSVALYVLVGYERSGRQAVEAALKYLILAATSAAMLLFGMALVYAELGTMQWTQLARAYAAGQAAGIMVPAGLALVAVGIGFKLALVPFHLWTPDVYQGSSAPVTAFIATVSKGAMFALLARLFHDLPLGRSSHWPVLFAVLAVASMVVGNGLALLQTNLKRMLAYSSIAHVGYLLVALLAGGSLATVAIGYYLASYFVTTLGAFGVIAMLSSGRRDADALDDYRGLAWRQPARASVLALMLLSLAGIPLTAGFVGKLYVLAAGAQSSLWWLVVVMVLNSAFGVFYYLRVIVTMVRETPSGAMIGSDGAAAVVTPNASFAGDITLGSLTAMVIWLGIDPSPLIRLLEQMGGR